MMTDIICVLGGGVAGYMFSSQISKMVAPFSGAVSALFAKIKSML